jgi:hypothetical protein
MIVNEDQDAEQECDGKQQRHQQENVEVNRSVGTCMDQTKQK